MACWTPTQTDTFSLGTPSRAHSWTPVQLPGIGDSCTYGVQVLTIHASNTRHLGFKSRPPLGHHEQNASQRYYTRVYSVF